MTHGSAGATLCGTSGPFNTPVRPQGITALLPVSDYITQRDNNGGKLRCKRPIISCHFRHCKALLVRWRRTNDQWRKPTWNSGGGGEGADSKDLAAGDGEFVRGYPHQRGRVWDRPSPLPRLFHLKWRVLVKLTEINYMYLIATTARHYIFLHCKCNASNLILEILKHDKIWRGGQFALASPVQILGDAPRDLRPCKCLLAALYQAPIVIQTSISSLCL